MGDSTKALEGFLAYFDHLRSEGNALDTEEEALYAAGDAALQAQEVVSGDAKHTPDLLAALKGLMADVETTARNSYTAPSSPDTFEVEWCYADPNGYAAWCRGRDAIAKATNHTPENPPPGRETPPVRMVCATCGSEEVAADAYAEWDTSIQRWTVGTVMDKGHFCGSCDGECRIKEVPNG